MVVARTSILGALALMILACCLSAVSFWAGLVSPAPQKFLLLTIAPWPLLGAAAIFYRAVVLGGRAIWIENATLRMGWFQRALLSDIRSIGIEDVDAPIAYMPIGGKYIVVRSRGGRALYSASVQHFTEDEDVILARLRAACGLPDDANAGTPGG